MRSISDQINGTTQETQCSPSPDCEQVVCVSVDGNEFDIIRSCSPIGVTLKMVALKPSPLSPDIYSELFTESGDFLGDYHLVIVDRINSTQFVFAMTVITKDGDSVLVTPTFIPTTSCGVKPTAVPTATPSTATPSTPLALTQPLVVHPLHHLSPVQTSAGQ